MKWKSPSSEFPVCFTNKSVYFIQIYITVTSRQNLGDNFRTNASKTQDRAAIQKVTFNLRRAQISRDTQNDANFSNPTNFRNEVRSFAQQFNQFQFLRLVPKITNMDPPYDLTAHTKATNPCLTRHNPTRTYGGVVVWRYTVWKI